MTRRTRRDDPARDGQAPTPADWRQLQYQPSPSTPLRTCARCGARYLDDPPGRDAHHAVFGHQPRHDQDESQ